MPDERLFSVPDRPSARPTKRPERARPHTKTIGDQTEAMVLARLVQVYPVVLRPFGENCRYDLLIDDEGDYIRVQCKTGRLKNGAVYFPACSTSYLTRADGARPRQIGYRGEADMFGVYCPEIDSVCLVPVAEVGQRMLRCASRRL